MWAYEAASRHRFLHPEFGARSIGKSSRCHFLTGNPRVFFLPQHCPYCGSLCDKLGEKDEWSRDNQTNLDDFNDVGQLLVCQKCGWWTVAVVSFCEEIDSEFMNISVGQVRGELKQFNTKAEGVPLEELHRYLLAHYEKRGTMDAYKVEDAVAEMYRDGGYQVVKTPKSKDGGVDLYIAQKDDSDLMVVQIKRTKAKVCVDLICSFAGVLLFDGIPRGVYVTTNDFTIDARSWARQLAKRRGYKIELVDAEQLYRLLRIHIRPRYLSEDDETAPFHKTWHRIREAANTRLAEMHRIEV